MTDIQKDVYFLTFLCTAIATALLFLALAISGAVLVVTDILFDPTSTAVVAAVTAAFFGWFWYGLPLLRRLRD